ncbi:MAG: hypothetical protein M3N82_00240 [Pseudomonadota bacterium]|nr:hypothetical protein [Pseudomonadota bacterium]
MTMIKPAPVVTEKICEAFVSAADALLQRRANLIAEDDIDDFVALGWMDWHGGSLRITPLGHMALLRLRTRVDAVA